MFPKTEVYCGLILSNVDHQMHDHILGICFRAGLISTRTSLYVSNAGHMVL